MRSYIAILLCCAASAVAQPVVLRSPQLQVTLQRETGLPAQFRLQSNGAVIYGAEPDHPVTATVFQAQPHQFQTVTLQPQSVKSTATRADFAFEVAYGGRPAASFTLRYQLQGAAVFVSLEDIREQHGYELIEVGTPDLATVREEDGGGWLAHGETGGNLIQLSAAKPGKLPPNRFWFGVAATLPVVMIGTPKALCVQEVIAFMDSTELAVEGGNGHRRAELGTVSAHRVNGSLAWDMNAEPGKPRIAGNNNTPNLMIGQRPLARLDFAADFDGNGTVDWLDGAKIVRSRMPQIPTHYYDDRLPYNLHIDEPRWPAPRMTFEQAAGLVHQMAMLTAYAPQDIYLWGWQFRGKDTGYPAVDAVNARAGGRDGLLKLMADGRAVNANVSFSDNYDDAYKSSPAWDTKYVARQPDGELWESRNWTGEMSYILGMAKYMAGPGSERVRYTCKEYPLKDTYLIDVLSYYPIRNDWDAEHPASGIKNLTEGRYRVLDEFRKCGLDIVSEQLRYAFIGKNSVNDNGPTGGPSPFGGDPIPLAAAIYRHSAIWGLSGQAWRQAPEIYSLFYNGHEFFGGPETPEHLADFYYSEMVPWFQVHYREVESYQRAGDRTLIGLAGNSSIDIDWKNLRYTVKVNGAEVAKDGDTFCPVGKDRIAFYSKKGGRLSAPLPAGWSPDKIAALALFTDHAEEARFSLADGKVAVDAPAARPIVLFRDGAAARRKMQVGTAPSPLLGLLDRFTAPDVPKQGPAEGPLPARNWPDPASLPGLPGRGIAQHPMLYAGEGYNTIFLVNQGKVIWTYSPAGRGEIDDVWMLTNGHILFAFQNRIEEVTPQKQVVWSYAAPEGSEVHSCQPIGLDKVLLVRNGLPPKLMIVNKKTGAVEVEHALPAESDTDPKTVHPQFRRIRMTSSGTYLAPFLKMNRVIEYDANFKPVWNYEISTPWAAVRLKNGNTLIDDEREKLVREVNPKGETVWEFKQSDLPPGITFHNIQTADRLANGNTVIFSSTGGTKPADRPGIIQAVELTPDKKVVWVLQDWKNLGPATTAQFLDEPGIPERPGDLQR